MPALLLAAAPAWSATVLLPEGMVIYAELGEDVSSRDRIGYQPDGHVWRDVQVGGVTVIEAGTPILLEISSASPSGVGGQSGAIEITAIELMAFDQEIQLRGGYGQEVPDSQTAGTVLGAAGAISGIPIGGFSGLMPGRKARLDKGLIFNTRIASDTYIEIPDDRMPSLNLRPPASLTIGVVYQEITAISTMLPLSIRLCGQVWSNDIAVEKVNDEQVPRIPADVDSVRAEGDCHSARATIALDALKIHFTPGINRFSMAVGDMTREVVLNIEI